LFANKNFVTISRNAVPTPLTHRHDKAALQGAAFSLSPDCSVMGVLLGSLKLITPINTTPPLHILKGGLFFNGGAKPGEAFHVT
jgi:hypothetical protein